VLSTSSPIDRLMLKRAARLARASKHPFARAIAEAAGDGPLANNVREFAGQGLEGEVDACQARLGQATWVGVHEAEGASSSVWYREEGLGPTRFAFTDEVRADAHATVARLKDRGLSVQMLSGDRNVPVSAVAFECQIEDWLAATGPTEKVEHLDRLASDGHQILMVGDGLNDAAALAAAHVSISPATGSNVSQAAADMVLTTDKLSPIVDAIDVARAARRLVLQNFAFAALYNVLAVPLAATGQVTPLIAAIAMSASSIVVMLNASRLAAKD
jgi:Cu2+-exporting ATPase